MVYVRRILDPIHAPGVASRQRWRHPAPQRKGASRRPPPIVREGDGLGGGAELGERCRGVGQQAALALAVTTRPGLELRGEALELDPRAGPRAYGAAGA